MSAFFSNVLKNLRLESKLSQRELAEDLGVSQVTVFRWERGYEPTMEKLEAIADYFGVSIERLFGDRNDLVRTVKTDEECELLDTFERLNKTNRIRLLGIGRGLLETQEEKTISR